MVEVSDNVMRQQIGSPHALKFSEDLHAGASQFVENLGSQKWVDERLGGASVADGFIQISGTDKRSQNYSPVPSINDGCHILHGVDAIKKEKQLEAEADDALNKPDKGETEPLRDQQEKDAANAVLQSTQDPLDSAALKRALEGLDKEQTQRVLGAVNKKLGERDSCCKIIHKYAQTPDGAVWLGNRKMDGTYEPYEMVRPPDCNVG